VNEVRAQYHELKLLSFDLDALCVNVMLNGLPEATLELLDRGRTFQGSVIPTEK